MSGESTEHSTSLLGFRIVRCEWMTHMKKAVQQGDTIYVSPAMYELLSKETGEDLRKLLESIPLIRLPEFKPVWEMPMTTFPGGGEP